MSETCQNWKRVMLCCAHRCACERVSDSEFGASRRFERPRTQLVLGGVCVSDIVSQGGERCQDLGSGSGRASLIRRLVPVQPVWQ